jgi:uncharacterized protein YbjT (DUF2867 family)
VAGLALGRPAGRVPDLGGPEVLTAAELARAYLNASGRRRPLLSVRLPAKAFDGYRSGGNLAPGHADGRRTYREFLAANPGLLRRRQPYGAARWVQPEQPGQPGNPR